MDPNIQTQPVQNQTPVTQMSLQQTTAQIPSSGSKFKWALLIVVLLLIIGGGTYYLGARQNKLIVQKQATPTVTQSTPTPTSDPTANWKTYTNTQNYYSFQYPDAMFSIQEEGSRTRLLEGMGYAFEVNAIQTTDTMENWLIKEKNNGQFPDDNWKSVQSTFQSYPALLLQSLSNTMQVAMDVFVIKNNNLIYEISFSKEASDKTVVDQILSTFKFINQTQKTYTGKDFTFTYPNNWLTDNTQVYDPLTAYRGGNGGNTILYRGQLWFSEHPTEQSLDQYITQYYGNQQGFKSNTVTVSNLQAESFYNPVGEGTAGWYIGFSNGKNVVLFGPEEQDIVQDPTLNTIINSFSFTR